MRGSQCSSSIFFFQAEGGIRDGHVTGVQTCALPISRAWHPRAHPHGREREGMHMRWIRLLGALLAALLTAAAALAAPASAGSGPSVTGGGSASDMTRFALAVQDGTGHFECLMPAVMTVESHVSSVTVSGAWATLDGTATVTLAAGTPFGAPGPMVRGVPYTAMVRAGGPGTGYVDLQILGMVFAGTVEQGQIHIGS